MKISLIILTLFLTINCTAQELLKYSEVIKLDSTITKDELYSRARHWFAVTFKDANSVLKSESKAEGELIAKPLIKYSQSFLSGSSGTGGVIEYTVSIYLKDGRYKYEITNFYHRSYSEISLGYIYSDDEYQGEIPILYTKNWFNRVYKDIKSNITEEVNSLIPSLKNSMQTKMEIKNDEW